jgi:hypothetical protein
VRQVRRRGTRRRSSSSSAFQHFDSQRFGGLSMGQGFVADALVRGDFELALKRHLAAPYRKESRRPKQAKRLIASKWATGGAATAAAARTGVLHRRAPGAEPRRLPRRLPSHPAASARALPVVAAELLLESRGVRLRAHAGARRASALRALAHGPLAMYTEIARRPGARSRSSRRRGRIRLSRARAPATRRARDS